MEIDEKQIKKLNRQLRAIRYMLTVFFLMLAAMLIIVGYIAYKVITFTNEVNNKVTNIENSTTQKLDIKSQLCADQTSSLARQFCND
jgi:cell division protein FtsL